MDDCTNRNVCYRECITRLNISRCAGDNSVSDLKVMRSDDVALLAVFITDEGDECAAVRIVLESKNLCRDIHLVALEIYNSVFALVAAATMANGNSTVAVATGVLAQVFKQALFRLNVAEYLIIGNGHITSRRSRRFKRFYSH